jgi:hypothetical protein
MRLCTEAPNLYVHAIYHIPFLLQTLYLEIMLTAEYPLPFMKFSMYIKLTDADLYNMLLLLLLLL